MVVKPGERCLPSSFVGSWSFPGALTELTEVIITARSTLGAYKDLGALTREAVQKERSYEAATSSDPRLDRLMGLGKAALRQVLAQVPRPVLARLLLERP